MNSLIKYGLYFMVAFSVLAFGAAEDGKGQRSEVRSRRSEDGGRKTEVGGQRSEDRGRRSIGHQTPLCELRTAGRRTQTERDRGRKSEARGRKSEVRCWCETFIRLSQQEPREALLKRCEIYFA